MGQRKGRVRMIFKRLYTFLHVMIIGHGFAEKSCEEYSMKEKGQ